MKAIRVLLLLLCAVVVTVNTAQAQGFTKKQINQYKKSCLVQNSEGLSSGAAEAYCACMTKNVVANFTPDEVLYPNAYVRQKIRSVAQVPCLQYPVRNIIFNKCLSDKSLEIYSSQKDNICNCVAEKSGQFMSQRVAKIIAQSNAETNWASVVLNDQEFSRNLTTNISLCVQGVGY